MHSSYSYNFDKGMEPFEKTEIREAFVSDPDPLKFDLDLVDDRLLIQQKKETGSKGDKITDRAKIHDFVVEKLTENPENPFYKAALLFSEKMISNPSSPLAQNLPTAEIGRQFLQKEKRAEEIVAETAIFDPQDLQKKVQELLQSVVDKTDYSSSYSMSIPMLGASSLADDPKYKKLTDDLIDKIFKSYSTQRDAPASEIVEKLKEKGTFNAWIIGRVLVAGIQNKEGPMAEKAAAVMEGLLEKSGNDAFKDWALGYLAIYYALKKTDQFPAIKERMLASTDELAAKPEEKGKDNVIWAIVMELQSLSKNKEDKTSYFERLEKLQTFTGTTSVILALEKIPSEDFRLWATSLVLSAAKKIGDTDNVQPLTAALKKGLEESTIPEDKMLALAVQNNA